MSTADPSEPEEFGPYLVYERLGMGGMATVHRAKKRGIAGYERGVALKRLLPHIADDQEFIHSFVREAKLASLLTHPNIAQIYEFGRVGAVYYIAMEHVDGIDVRKILRYARRSGEVVPLPVVLSILAELCDALEYAHTFVDENGEHQGIIHRDVSPSNLIVANSGHLKVIDFGIAKASSRQHHTESGRVKGKLGYMSPEAALGTIYGPASDVFSAGVVAYELLTTHPLFSSKTDYETLLKIHHSEIPVPSQLNVACPPELDAVVTAALTRVPEERIQSAAELRAGLEEVANRGGFRLSSREVFDWLAGVSNDSSAISRSITRSQQLRAASTSQLRPLPLPPPPPEPRGRPGGRVTSIAHAAALAELGRAPGVGGGLVELSRTSADDDLIADIAWGADPSSSMMRHPIAESSGVQPAPQGTVQLPSPQPLASATGSNPGARQVASGRRRSLWIGLLALVAVAAVAAIVVTRNLRPATSATSRAVLDFEVQPTDAVIEIGGHEVSRTSPFQAALAPGVYSISIRRDGYKPWSSNVTIRGGESQAIRVALDPTEVGVGSGQSAAGATPVAPGATGASAAVETAAQDGAVSELDPEQSPAAPAGRDRDRAGDKGRGDRAARGDRAGRGEGSDPESLETDLGAIGQGGSKGARPAERAASAVAEPKVTAATRTPLAVPPPKEAPIEAPVSAVTSAPAEGLALPKVALAPARVPVVAAGAVAKISGTIPAIHARGSDDSFSDVVAKLCIDEQGLVSSAKILRAAGEIEDQVRVALKTWRYKPYLVQGKPSPACFAVQMRVVVLPSN